MKDLYPNLLSKNNKTSNTHFDNKNDNDECMKIFRPGKENNSYNASFEDHTPIIPNTNNNKINLVSRKNSFDNNKLTPTNSKNNNKSIDDKMFIEENSCDWKNQHYSIANKEFAINTSNISGSRTRTAGYNNIRHKPSKLTSYIASTSTDLSKKFVTSLTNTSSFVGNGPKFSAMGNSNHHRYGRQQLTHSVTPELNSKYNTFISKRFDRDCSSNNTTVHSRLDASGLNNSKYGFVSGNHMRNHSLTSSRNNESVIELPRRNGNEDQVKSQIRSIKQRMAKTGGMGDGKIGYHMMNKLKPYNNSTRTGFYGGASSYIQKDNSIDTSTR